MRFVIKFLLSFVIAGFVTTAAATLTLQEPEGEADLGLLLVVTGFVIPCISLYLLQARLWSEWLFQWFFWLGCLCLAAACFRAWEAFRYQPAPYSEPWEWRSSLEAFVYLRIISIFSGVMAGLFLMGIALVQDHLRWCRGRIRESKPG